MTPPKSQTATGAASNLMLKATVRTIDYKVPCDFDGDPHPDSEATVEVLIPNGFGESLHLNLCNSCYQKIRSLEAIPRLKGTELRAKVEKLSSLMPFYCEFCGRWFLYPSDHIAKHGTDKPEKFIRANEVLALLPPSPQTGRETK